VINNIQVTVVTYVDSKGRSHIGLSNLVNAARTLGYGAPVVLGEHDAALLVKREAEWRAWLRRARHYADFAASRTPDELLLVIDAFDTLLVGGPLELERAFETVAEQTARDATAAAATAHGESGSQRKGSSHGVSPVAVDPREVVVVAAERLCDSTDCRRRRLSHLKQRMEARAADFARHRRADATGAAADKANDEFEKLLATQARYLNAGVLVGRAGAVSKLFADSLRLQERLMVDDQSSYVQLAFGKDTDDLDGLEDRGKRSSAWGFGSGSGTVGGLGSEAKVGGANRGGYRVVLDYASALAGVVSPVAVHLWPDWSIRVADLDGLGASNGPVLERRLTGNAPVVLHVAGVRYTGDKEQRMNSCQALLIKVYNCIVRRQQVHTTCHRPKVSRYLPRNEIYEIAKPTHRRNARHYRSNDFLSIPLRLKAPGVEASLHPMSHGPVGSRTCTTKMTFLPLVQRLSSAMSDVSHFWNRRCWTPSALLRRRPHGALWCR
jgi:hypothetical protein